MCINAPINVTMPKSRSASSLLMRKISSSPETRPDHVYQRRSALESSYLDLLDSPAHAVLTGSQLLQIRVLNDPVCVCVLDEWTWTLSLPYFSCVCNGRRQTERHTQIAIAHKHIKSMPVNLSNTHTRSVIYTVKPEIIQTPSTFLTLSQFIRYSLENYWLKSVDIWLVLSVFLLDSHTWVMLNICSI